MKREEETREKEERGGDRREAKKGGDSRAAREGMRKCKGKRIQEKKEKAGGDIRKGR